MLDEIMEDPEQPDSDLLIAFETKILQETKDMLRIASIDDTYNFVKNSPHKRLWKIVADNALERLNFPIAMKCFVQSNDYPGIQFVKRVQQIGDKNKQMAEVSAYFKKFEDAEKIYLSVDRRDLAISMRQSIGDWLGVLQLMKEDGSSDDSLKEDAWNHLGNYHMERHQWSRAVKYYVKAQNFENLIECYYLMEEYDALASLIVELPEGSPLLMVRSEICYI